MKTRNKVFLLAAMMMLLVALVASVTIAQAADNITMTVKGSNLSLQDSIYLMLAVDTPYGADTQLLVWRTADATKAYKVGSQDETLTYKAKQGNFYVYYLNLFAKELADDVYVRAYYKDGDTEYYSEPYKASVLQYAYNKLGITGTAGNAKLQALMTAMLEYGAAAQDYLGYNTDRKATDTFYQINVSSGKLADGTNKGLYKEGTALEITANDKSGYDFTNWTNNKGLANITTSPASIAMPAAHVTYTANYAVVDLESVTIADATVAVGAQVAIDVTYNPSNYDPAVNPVALTWESGNTNVATVDDGIVTGISAGTALIQVYDEAGDIYAECTVTVSSTPVTSIVLNVGSAYELEVGQSKTFVATVSPADASNKAVTWSSSNTDIATVTADGLVTVVTTASNVQATITATAKDGSGVTAKCVVTVIATNETPVDPWANN